MKNRTSYDRSELSTVVCDGLLPARAEADAPEAGFTMNTAPGNEVVSSPLRAKAPLSFAGEAATGGFVDRPRVWSTRAGWFLSEDHRWPLVGRGQHEISVFRVGRKASTPCTDNVDSGGLNPGQPFRSPGNLCVCAERRWQRAGRQRQHHRFSP